MTEDRDSIRAAIAHMIWHDPEVPVIVAFVLLAGLMVVCAS